jgi:metal-sulfur cluster biosynthetic enzyme
MSDKSSIESTDTVILPPNVPFGGKPPAGVTDLTASTQKPLPEPAPVSEPLFPEVHTGLAGDPAKAPPATPTTSGEAAVHTGLAGDPNAPPSPPADESAMIDALKEVIDPELMINIVDLGLVYNITLDERKVHVEMTLTSPACPAGPQIVQQSKMALERLPGIESVNIRLVMSPPWSPARMTDEARDQLGIF